MGLRQTFVAMLFALTAGQIALSSADLYVICKDADEFPSTFFAPAAHLVLALLIVSTSWVGWSVGSRKTVQLTHPFSWHFIVLLIDVLLVVTYFVIVREVEINEVFQRQPALAGQSIGEYGVTKQISNVSASGEAGLVAIMFLLYLLWDVVHDKFLKKAPLRVAAFASVAAFIAAFVLYVLCRSQSQGATVLSVVFGDLALVGIVIGFRAIKGAEEPLANWFKVQHESFRERDFAWKMWLGLSIAVFVVGLIGMLLTSSAPPNA